MIDESCAGAAGAVAQTDSSDAIGSQGAEVECVVVPENRPRSQVFSFPGDEELWSRKVRGAADAGRFAEARRLLTKAPRSPELDRLREALLPAVTTRVIAAPTSADLGASLDAFSKLEATLPGQWCALRGAELVDHDVDELAMRRRLRARGVLKLTSIFRCRG